MKKPLTVATLVMGVGAIVTLIFSFLDFYSSGNTGFSAWSGDLLFPASAIPAILGLALIVLLVLDLVGVKLPEKVLTFTWPQIYATIGISAAGMMLGWLFTSPGFGSSKGAGMILMLIGSLAMAAGSIMGLLGIANNTIGSPSSGSATPPPPGAPVQPGFPPQAPGFPPQAPPPPPPGGSTPPPPPPPA